MRIHHLAIWVSDLELMKAFYLKYFNMKCSDKYVNSKKEFQSYFLYFDETCKIEIMTRPDIKKADMNNSFSLGLTHFSISLGSKEKVDLLTEQLREDLYTIAGEPRTTGDGFYESLILDTEGNGIELTI